MGLHMIRISLVIALCLQLISGCALPANQQSLPWTQPIQHYAIKTVAPGLYQMDQFVVTYEGLEIMLQQELVKGNRPDVVIKKNIFLNLHDEEIRIAQLAESHGLRVFQASLFGVSETTSEKMQWQAEQVGYEDYDEAM